MDVYGRRAHRAGLLERAEAYFTRSVAAYSGIDSPWGTVKSQSQLADVKRLQGDFDRAQELFYSCLLRSSDFSNRRETLTVLALYVRLLHSRKDWELSLSLAAGLLHLSDTFPDGLILYHNELQTIIAEAAVHLDKKAAEAMLLGARHGGLRHASGLCAYASTAWIKEISVIDLSGRHIFIAGGSRGIGAAAA